MAVIRDGKVAVRHWNSNPVAQVINGNLYHFVPQHGASIAWVEESDVPALFTLKATICCGHTKQKYDYATETAVTVWETGHQ